jgi:hypothetical protein
VSKQVFYPYTELEEHKAGMWRAVWFDRTQYIDASAALMRDSDAFLVAMFRAVNEWPKSCEAAMTTPSINRRAWMGHAGCCIATGSPEDLTRLGWHSLTIEEQDRANAAADLAIAEWENRQMTGGLWSA